MKKVFRACHLILFFTIIATFPAHSVEMRRDTLCTSINFRQGYSIIDPDFENNRASLQRMTAWLDSLSAGESIIRLVTVRGSASPEGFTPYNRKLSIKRAENIGRHLMASRALPDSIVKAVDSDVDWELLRRMVLESGQEWSEEAAKIIAETPIWIFDKEGKIIDGKKRQLAMLGGGRPWFFMSQHFFPAMRNAGYTIICEHEPAAATYVAETTIDNRSEVTDTAMAIVLPPPQETAMQPAQAAAATVDAGQAPGTRFTALLKTNMLYDAAAVPNIAMEIALGNRWSIEAGWMYAGWKSAGRHRSWRINGGEAGVRFYIKGAPGDNSLLTGHHIGIYGQMLTYDFQFGGEGEIADNWSYGAGIAYGYSLPVARHLNIDFTLGIGYLGGKYKKYHPVDDCDVWDATYTRNWFGPTKVEVALVWYIGGNKARKGGGK